MLRNEIRSHRLDRLARRALHIGMVPDLVTTLTEPRMSAGGEIERRLADLEFLNGALRNVLSGGADGLVAGIDAINLDAGGATETATEGDRGESFLGGIDVAAVLDLNAGLELGEIEEVAAVDGKVLDLHGRGTPCTVACSVLTSSDSPSTCTICVAWPSCIFILPGVVTPTSAIAVCSVVLKPWASTRMV